MRNGVKERYPVGKTETGVEDVAKNIVPKAMEENGNIVDPAQGEGVDGRIFSAQGFVVADDGLLEFVQGVD